MIFGHQKQLFTPLRIFGDPGPDILFGFSAFVAVGSIKIADTELPGHIEVLGIVCRHHATQIEDGHFRSVFTQLALGQNPLRRSRRISLRRFSAHQSRGGASQGDQGGDANAGF